MKDKQFLGIAAEQFLGKKEDEITDTILQTLEGHLRAILGTLTVEEVYKDRDQFANLVREIATPDVGKMGIEILSFTIKDVYDNVDYLSSLGKTQTAAVKRDAEIGVAQVKSVTTTKKNSFYFFHFSDQERYLVEEAHIQKTFFCCLVGNE